MWRVNKKTAKFFVALFSLVILAKAGISDPTSDRRSLVKLEDDEELG